MQNKQKPRVLVEKNLDKEHRIEIKPSSQAVIPRQNRNRINLGESEN